MELSPEKLSELRQIIRNELGDVSLRGYFDDIRSNQISDRNASRPVVKDENRVMDELRRKGVIEEILSKLKLEPPGFSEESMTEEKATDPGRQYLYLQFLGGKAFLEHLDVSSTESHPCSTFMLHVHFRGQRFHSKCVPVSCEPHFSESFLLELQAPSGSSIALGNTDTLLSICDPIHIVLTRKDSDDMCTLVSSQAFDWRNALAFNERPMKKSIELMGIGPECKVPAGIVDVQLQLLPSGQITTVAPQVIEAQLHLERQRCAERERLFLVYAKQWWKEYVQIRDEHKSRRVRIFAQDETGVNRAVCGFVQPMRSARLISTPRMAARFVSTFEYEKASYIGTGNKTEQWQSLHAFLASKKGDHEDHSNLLCSLLLGFGLEAYVCVGLKTNNSTYSWVVTRYCDGTTVFFWDPVTGQRYSHHRVEPDDPPAIKQPVTNHPFKTVGCLYNHNSFYANIQPFDLVETTDFDVDNQTLWKRMCQTSILSVCGSAYPNICIPLPPLRPPSIDSALISNKIEAELKMMIFQHRKDLNLTTVWDDHLGHLLGPSLAAYELERSSGLSNIGNDDFQDAIRRAVPEGNTFKGFPVQIVHCNARRAFRTCLKSSVCCEIVECRGGEVRLAVRCHSTVFPDDCVATWIMYACRYRSIL